MNSATGSPFDRLSSALVRARAPLRLGLAGGGTDVAPYSELHGGAVLNVTVDLYASVTLSPRPDAVLRIDSLDSGTVWEGPGSIDLQPEGEGALAKGVFRHFLQRCNGSRPCGLNVATFADVPPGSGLGTSSAMVVALVEAFARLFQAPMSPYEVAHLAYLIERVDLKLSGGKQDQYASTFGGFNLIEFGPGDGVLVNPLRIPQSTLAEFESSLILFFSGVSRDSARIIDQQSARISSGDAASLDAMHHLKLSALQMKEALLRGEIARLAGILDASYAHKKRTAANIATPHTDAIYDAAKAAGALGGKVSGAGGGGFMMFLADAMDRPHVLRALQAFDGQLFACRLTDRGSHAWSVDSRRSTLSR